MTFRILTTCVILGITGCGWFEPSPLPFSKHATFEIYEVSPTADASTKPTTVTATGETLNLKTTPFLTSSDVATVERCEEPTGAALGVNLTSSGERKMKSATLPTGQQIAVVINGDVFAAPTIRSSISKSFVVTGNAVDGDFDQMFRDLTEP